VLDYNFGNFKLYNTVALDVANNMPEKEIAQFSAGADQITVATFNLENLDPSDDLNRFAALAIEVVTHLLSPDILAVQEVQDNNGADDGTVDADRLTSSNRCNYRCWRSSL
jgi:endonuclease/exonuclease/phosphatase family metal-dependent hydrolase